MNTVFEEIHKDILAFIKRPGNESLLNATGPESTPFRGTFLGVREENRAQSRMGESAPRLLWLGSNPNVPAGLKASRRKTPIQSRLNAFEKQTQAGIIGHVHDWRGEDLEKPWDPINQPKGAWSIYLQALENAVGLQSLAFMNYFFWGSSNLKSFRLEQPELFRRALEFCDRSFSKIVIRLRPSVIMLPFSLEREARSHGAELDFLHRILGQERQENGFQNGPRRFRWYTSLSSAGFGPVMVITVPHPSSIRLTRDGRRQIQTEITLKIRTFIKNQLVPKDKAGSVQI